MYLASEIKDQVIVQADISTTLAYFTDTILNDFIDKAHKWAAGYKKWPMTEGRVSTTYASLTTNEDGYLTGVYPENWKPESIRRLTIGGKKVTKKNFFKFAEFLEDNTSNSDRIFSDFGKLYFINPRIDVSGTVTAWGQYSPADLDATDSNAKTVFSDSAEEGNDAVFEEVMSFVKRKMKKEDEAIAHHEKATAVLEKVWEEVQGEQFGYGETDSEGMFKRIDVLGGAYQDDIRRDRFY